MPVSLTGKVMSSLPVWRVAAAGPERTGRVALVDLAPPTSFVHIWKVIGQAKKADWTLSLLNWMWALTYKGSGCGLRLPDGTQTFLNFSGLEAFFYAIV